MWYEAVEEEIRKHEPDVIVANGGDNQFDEGALVMNKEDIHLLQKKSPESEIIVVHMEAVNHWTLSREELRSSLSGKGISNVIVPEDGETMTP
ncbi:hypothetical protein SAMN05421687_104247 [Salimicrobium flavidum]|uniref:Uncharacterized protein n=1 Tax=Salimicrobium flavidum TaxID=570947 RepID=A0A1N7J9Z2_9BACI|nr:hypothetical protein [Salimicrobium flavidum]SIS46162.1 hypothetical protein SAMN05421687_104247 [Salimicrobium flavidum]